MPLLSPRTGQAAGAAPVPAPGPGAAPRPAPTGRLALLEAAATAGSGALRPDRAPDRLPNHLYDLLAPGWTQRNQRVLFDTEIARLVTERLLNDAPDKRDFAALVSRVDPVANRRDRLRRVLADALNAAPVEEFMRTRDGRTESLVEGIVHAYLDRPVSLRPTEELLDRLYADGYGWGPLEPYLNDPSVTDIMVNRHDRVNVDRVVWETGPDGMRTPVARKTLEPIAWENRIRLQEFAKKMAEEARQKPSVANPTIDFSLPTGERVNITFPPISTEATIVIRRFQERNFTLDQLVGYGSLDRRMQALLHWVNRAGATIVTYGPTGSGKTSLVSALIADKDPNARLVIVEDTREIAVDETRHLDVARHQTSEDRDMRALVRNALRERPTHLIIGETRDATALDLVRALMTGQNGSITTLHADSPVGALTTLVMLMRQADNPPTQEAAVMMVSDAVHVLVHAARLPDGKRLLMSIDEVLEPTADFRFRVRNIFRVEMGAEGTPPRFVLDESYRPSGKLARLMAIARMDPMGWLSPDALETAVTPEAPAASAPAVAPVPDVAPVDDDPLASEPEALPALPAGDLPDAPVGPRDDVSQDAPLGPRTPAADPDEDGSVFLAAPPESLAPTTAPTPAPDAPIPPADPAVAGPLPATPVARPRACACGRPLVDGEERCPMCRHGAGSPPSPGLASRAPATTLPAPQGDAGGFRRRLFGPPRER